MASFPKKFDGECRPNKGPSYHFWLIKGPTLVTIRRSRPVAEPPLPPGWRERRDDHACDIDRTEPLPTTSIVGGARR